MSLVHTLHGIMANDIIVHPTHNILQLYDCMYICTHMQIETKEVNLMHDLAHLSYAHGPFLLVFKLFRNNVLVIPYIVASNLYVSLIIS